LSNDFLIEDNRAVAILLKSGHERP
jgi:hypothetical protein